mmetsp:Transcript_2527/g.4373  ORF Transcript_2527/g.4373 Transcript_2527/m.4373 type:complete len:200 (-) Transcript_2527:3565-4164(-)
MVGIPRAVIIAGPSGVGKGTLIEKLKTEFAERVGFSVSHTTRAPRHGEVDGVSYHFTTVEKMRAGIAQGHFIEWAEVHGRYYGTSFAAVEQVRKSGRLCILDIDVQGCRAVRRAGLPALFIFLAPPSFEELERRLRGRGTETSDAIQTRLTNARMEMEARDEAGLFDHVLINDNLDQAYSTLSTYLREELDRAKPESET